MVYDLTSHPEAVTIIMIVRGIVERIYGRMNDGKACFGRKGERVWIVWVEWLITGSSCAGNRSYESFFS